MVIKKLAIEEGTPSEEVSLALASIELTLSRKSYEFTGIKTGAIDSLADTLVKGKRKSFVSLAEALSSLKPTALKASLLAACPTEKHLPIAENYLLKTLLDKLGFKTNLDPQTLADVYPNLKVTKPRGNFGKKKS